MKIKANVVFKVPISESAARELDMLKAQWTNLLNRAQRVRNPFVRLACYWRAWRRGRRYASRLWEALIESNALGYLEVNQDD